MSEHELARASVRGMISLKVPVEVCRGRKTTNKNKTRRSVSHTAHLSCCQDTALPPRQQLGKRGCRRSHCVPLRRDVLQRQAQDGRARKRVTWCSIMVGLEHDLDIQILAPVHGCIGCRIFATIVDTNFDMLNHLARPQ